MVEKKCNLRKVEKTAAIRSDVEKEKGVGGGESENDEQTPQQRGKPSFLWRKREIPDPAATVLVTPLRRLNPFLF